MSYLEAVQRARSIERLPIEDQDAAIVTLLHMFPEQRAKLLLRLVQLVPEDVAAAVDELEYHAALLGDAGEVYEAAQARYEIYRAASAPPAPDYAPVVDAIAGHGPRCNCGECQYQRERAAGVIA